MTQDDAEQRERVIAALLAFSVAQNEIGRRFARSQRLHTTDAAAIVEILGAEDRGQPLTPARLAERISLTTGATSTLLNRLEDAGHVTRTREHTDRRVVTLHTTPASHELADSYYAPLREQLDAVADGFGDGDLEVVEAFLSQVRATIYGYLDDEAAAPDVRSPGRSG